MSNDIGFLPWAPQVRPNSAITITSLNNTTSVPDMFTLLTSRVKANKINFPRLISITRDQRILD